MFEKIKEHIKNDLFRELMVYEFPEVSQEIENYKNSPNELQEKKLIIKLLNTANTGDKLQILFGYSGMEDYAIRKLSWLKSTDADLTDFKNFISFIISKSESFTNENLLEFVRGYSSIQKINKPIDKIRKINGKDPKKDSINILFEQYQSPGDVLTLTASVRDMKKKYPHLNIKVKTSVPELWEHNPYLTDFPDEEADIKYKLDYPLVNRASQCGQHFLYGFKEDIERKLNLPFDIREFKCDLHLSEEEKGWENQVAEHFKHKGKFWLVNSGHKECFPLKQWRRDYWQEAINELSSKLNNVKFVQVGESGHYHRKMDNVLNLIGRTDMRQLIRLVYHCEGVIGHVSMLNHLASCWNKPAITIAGGRETATWEAYNETTYLDTIGQMDCCWDAGCWKSKPEECENLEEHDKVKVGKCMSLIKPSDVVNAVMRYYEGGRLKDE